MVRNKLQIAIDGPVAAGKGTIAAQLAKKLGIVYVDTGSMYRAVALLAMQDKIDFSDENKLVQALNKSTIELKVKRRNQHSCEILLNGEDVSNRIRTPAVSRGASIVATLPKVRRLLVQKQRDIAKSQSVVMEGRDITTKVLPNADLKIYLTASRAERARRRKKQLAAQGIKVTFKKILEETRARDERDSRRKNDPLVVVPDAYVLDTTHLSKEAVVSKILQRLNLD